MERAVRQELRYGDWVLVAVPAVSAPMATQVRNLRIVIDPASLLPQAHPNVVGTNLAERLFGNKYLVVVGVSRTDGSTALGQHGPQTVARLADAIGAVRGVRRHTVTRLASERMKSIAAVYGALTVEPLLARPVDEDATESLQRRVPDRPLVRGTLLSFDEQVTTVSFSVEVSERGFRAVVDRVPATIYAHRAPGLEIDASGTPVFFAAVERFSQRMGWLFPIALVLIGLLRFEAFRTIQGMALPLVTAVLAVLWTLGLMGAIRLPMDAFNATAPILVLAVAAGHAVQILKRYCEEVDRIFLAAPDAIPTR